MSFERVRRYIREDAYVFVEHPAPEGHRAEDVGLIGIGLAARLAVGLALSCQLEGEVAHASVERGIPTICQKPLGLG
jgi:hypothetical protein